MRAAFKEIDRCRNNSTLLVMVLALLSPGLLWAEAAKPTDPQIAHIAYTEDCLTLKREKSRLSKNRTRCSRLCTADD